MLKVNESWDFIASTTTSTRILNLIEITNEKPWIRNIAKCQNKYKFVSDFDRFNRINSIEYPISKEKFEFGQVD